MTQQSPEEIRADIERTRSSLSLDVDAVADKVSPSKVAQRQTEKIRSTVGGWKDHVMGSADDASTKVSDQAHHAADGVQQAPGAAKQKTRGNPLAAGLIALGAGWLAASIVPASEPEKRAAAKLEDRAQPLVDDAKSQAKSMAEELKEPAQESVQRVRDSAAESAQNVKSEGQEQKDTVTDSAQSSAQDVRGS
ncbi:DUF3618 domain-containing protein [Nesterenkonia sp. CF4.4]|uniref:DUF3618 domain-containing protein n=1 Tax=Nesterenkonia sp. CF4.4 TaxID=3373079 RepID=UPI003EE6090E